MFLCELDKRRRANVFTNGLLRMLGMVSNDIFCGLNLLTIIIEQFIPRLVCPWILLLSYLPSMKVRKFFQQNYTFFTPNTSHLKESAELCPGCNCPMDETTDYQLVLTRRSSSRFAKIAISSQTNKLPIPRVPPSQNSFIMLCFFF